MPKKRPVPDEDLEPTAEGDAAAYDPAAQAQTLLEQAASRAVRAGTTETAALELLGDPELLYHYALRLNVEWTATHQPAPHIPGRVLAPLLGVDLATARRVLWAVRRGLVTQEDQLAG
jgi:hypothetical protein